MKINRNIFLLLVLLFLFSIIPIFLNNDYLRVYSFYNYLFHELLIFIPFFFITRRTEYLLSPSFITASYININFLLGAWAYYNNLILYPEYLEAYWNWKHLNISTFFFNISNCLIIFSYFIILYQEGNKVRQKTINIDSLTKILMFLSAIILIVLFEILNLIDSQFNGFYIIPKTIGALILFVLISQSKSRLRFIWYIIIIGFFVIFSFENKREAIFLILPIGILELIKIKLRINFRFSINVVILVLFILYAIILMSIARGYGQYGVKNVFEARKFVSNYIHKQSFLASFMNNIEVSTTYLHSNQAIEYIMDDPSLLTYGITIAKVIFIPVPRSLFPQKPESIVTYYTRKFNPEFRARGGSFPISFLSEMFWNFHLGGILILFILYLIINKVYFYFLRSVESNNIIKKIYLLYGYYLLLYLIRGSGLDWYFVFFIIGTAVSLIYYFIIYYLKSLSVKGYTE